MQSITNFYKPIKPFIMKKTLLLFTFAMLSITTMTIAQNRTWEIGTTSTSWPADLAQMTTGTQEINGLTVAAVSATFGGMAVAPASIVFSDGYDPENEWKSNGNSSITGALPARRYFSFPVTGPSTIKVWFRVNGTGARACLISDGTNILGQMTDEDSTKPLLLTVSYTGAAGTIYVYSNSSINYHKIAVTDGVLSNKNFQKDLDITVFAKDSKIYLSNIKSTTKVNVYNVLGSLVKTAQVDADSSLDINSGIYIVNAKSADGEKSVKVIVQ
ncbi:hypothetical protein C3L50_04645 [Flavobacterium alvei]|uniref:DUF6383 domain-containing protein n=2 Tax=Flavobacterium alvei TaxID=2080416 RepID=A0A2S5AEQ8_9FLAO|nr:hypothetical protein C3L50_04645 [Flavobacterium alvei]